MRLAISFRDNPAPPWPASLRRRSRAPWSVITLNLCLS